MKLKKLLALALAGVMAVSMLAGCKGGNKTDDPEKEPVNMNVLSADAIIAELSKDTTDAATVTGDSSMEAALNKIVAERGTKFFENATTGYNGDIIAAYKDIVESDYYVDTFKWGDLKKDDADPQTIVAAYVIKADGQTEKKANMTFAAEIDGMVKNVATPSHSTPVGDDYYKFNYAVSVAAVKVQAGNGYDGYLAVVTLTATSTPAEL